MDILQKDLLAFQYKDIVKDVKNSLSPIFINGFVEEAIGVSVKTIQDETNTSSIIITYDEARARRIYEDLKNSHANVYYLKKREMLFYNVSDSSLETEYSRIQTLMSVLKDKNSILIMDVKTLDEELICQDIYKSLSFSLKTSQIVNIDELTSSLTELGYKRASIASNKGEFALRGSIVDIFDSISDMPFRIEFFSDEIDSIRIFDKDTQKTIATTEEITINPAREILILDKYKKNIIDNLKKDFDKTKEANKSSYSLMNEKFKEYFEMLKEDSFDKNRSLLLRYIPDKFKSSIFDYFDENTYIYLDESKRLEEEYDKYINFHSQEMESLYKNGEILLKEFNAIMSYGDVLNRIKKNNLVLLSNILLNTKDFNPKAIYNLHLNSVTKYNSKYEALLDDLRHYKLRGYKILLSIKDIERYDRVYSLLKDNDIAFIQEDEVDDKILSNQLLLRNDSSTRGFVFSENKFIVLSENDIYGSQKEKIRKKKSSKKLDISDISEGTYIVHEDHGVGIYKGIVKLEVLGVKKDFLYIQYKGEDKLYVPIAQMDRIQKFSDKDSKDVKINKLSTNDWIKQKSKSKKAIEKMAEDLVELYAIRKEKEGYAFSKDTAWQRDFEESFPYEETKGQLEAIIDIKRDMESNKPMDRLLCGDVGFGKTEVALRAAFKAIMDGKQVAFLCPTTILCQQHYETIIERFNKYPIRSAMMSRFRTSKEQKQTAEELKTHSIDIVVGTHRLLSDDVRFKDLGLLIIDEEQRFGVRDKEKIKKLKENVDVLSLSATPIPRTMHMALSGIRSMSVIEEAPQDRYPIQTYVLEYNKSLVRDAILKEMDRDGQVFFVFNNVENIDKMYNELQNLVPEARIAIGHGQMTESKLEKVMMDFMYHKYDVLLSTTIIETGLDIPNANTIIVYNSENMGLSQLYQLRGRVGRMNRIAYGYFTYKENKVLTETQEERLKAIKEFTELGSGYKIAMRDLQIRGAGNLLGTSQHGHIAAIGYDLYIKYLNLAIKKLRGYEVKEDIDTRVDITVDAYIPDDFAPDEYIKMDLYKKIAAVENEEMKSELIDEIVDRFADIPKSIVNLIDISEIRSMAKEFSITSINEVGGDFRIEFLNDKVINPQWIADIYKKYKNRLYINKRYMNVIRISIEGKNKIKLIKEILILFKMSK